MPIIIAQILRTVIMALVSGGSVTMLQNMVDGTFKTLVTEIASEGGLSQEEAKDIFVNILVELAINSTAIGVVLKTKLAVKTAEFLGLTSKGLIKRTLTPKATETAAKLVGPAGIKIGMSMGKKVILAASGIGSIIWLISALANIIEPGIYKPNETNAVYRKLGIPFQYPVNEGALQPGPFDGPQFRDYAKAIEAAGVIEIENPGAKERQVYSRKSLALVIDYVYGQEVLQGNSPSAKQLIPLLAQYLITKKGVTPSAPSVVGAVYTAPVVSHVRVFSGVVSQGVIGSTATFTPRQDDLIENAEELSQASHNNLAPFIASLGSRLSYEIKVVPSIKSASGWTQRGTAQRVISGYNKDGSPKYRTVVNKFATMDIFVKTDKGTQSKITTIVLGPVDSVRFQGANVNLGQVAVGVQQNIIAPASVATPTVTPTTGATSGPTVPSKESGQNVPYLIYKFTPNGQPSYQALPATNTPYGASVADLTEARAWFAINPTALVQQQTIPGFDSILAGQFVDSGLSWGMDKLSGEMGWGTWKAKEVAQVAPVVAPVATTATTLFSYYQAHGQSLPGVEERSKLYEQLGLGQSAYYTGTAEQNTKLLAALQGSRL